MSVKVKVCGLTRPDDAAFACQVGADFCGVVVEVKNSPRSQSRTQAKRLFAKMTKAPVLVTRDKPLNDLIALVLTLFPFAVQLHGDETPEFAAALKRKVSCAVWKAIPLPTQLVGAHVRELLPIAHAFVKAGCDALLLDAATPKGFGGQGVTVAWELAAILVERLDVPCLLAGGLTPENVAEAIATVKPWGVDVSSGVEHSPGIKDAEKVRLFCQRAKSYLFWGQTIS